MTDAHDTPAEPAAASVPQYGDAPVRRSLLRSVLIGAGVGVGLAAITFFLIAIPFYTLASFEPNGIDRPIVRTGLFRVALPVGALVGIVGGAVAGRWVHQGGRWVAEDGGDRYSTR